MTGKKLPLRTRLVWDLPTRLFHWLLVGLVAIAWVSGEAEGPYFVVHQLAGYGIMVAILFRLLWGFMGNASARFRDFVHPWPVVRDYAKSLAALRPTPTLGHNPLGGWMVLLLLGALGTMVVTGLYAADDGFRGPLAGAITPDLVHTVAEVHESLSVFLLLLIGIHVAGVLFDSLLTRDNLVRAMITGRKERHGTAGAAEPPLRSPSPAWRAPVALGVATGLTWLTVV